MINKDTMVFGSFAGEAGNTGCSFFNSKFKELGIDAIYKSYSIEDIGAAVKAARCLNFSGFAVSMPYKITVLPHIDEMTSPVQQIGAANTIINREGKLIAYNTDYYAAHEILISCTKDLVILGNGGYARAVKAAADDLGLSYQLITRSNWDEINEIRNNLVFNCTPVKNLIVERSNEFIDCNVLSPTGARLAHLQAMKQLELYTGTGAT